jgi:aspartyl-tRNA(Asn)/glutamyl-tRNA(Gln) amidotransferase subunit A
MKIFLDDMILTKDLPTTAGSKMLDGYKSVFDATVVEKITEKGYEIAGKTAVGEMAIDLVGETCYAGKADTASALNEADALIAFDVNGAPRRVAAQNGLVFVKPTYGTVSRFGTVAAACSGECVGVMAKTADVCERFLPI